MVSWKTHLRIGWRREFTFWWFRPYFTLSRYPWRLTREQYPLRLDWRRHAWFVAKRPGDADRPGSREDDCEDTQTSGGGQPLMRRS